MIYQQKRSFIARLTPKQAYFNWYQQPAFVLFVFLLLVLYAIFLLPQDLGIPSTQGIISIAGLLLLSYAWTGNLIIDRRKPELLKNGAVVILLILHGWLFYRYSGAEWDLLGRQFFDFAGMSKYWTVLFDALGVTLQIALGCFVMTPLIGITLAIFRSFDNRIINAVIISYVDIFRSTPDIVLIVMVYFALPYIGIQFDSLTAVIVALTLLYGAYATENFRAGIQSIHKIQIEAARALGLTNLQTMRLVILPQAIRVVIPPFTSLLVGILKSTAIASVAAAPELMTRGRQLVNQMSSVTPLLAVALIYLVFILPLVILSNEMEKRVAKYKKKV